MLVKNKNFDEAPVEEKTEAWRGSNSEPVSCFL
jgi:hypothetical protein